ncbi:MAG: PDGLE domain-containing protein [Verrucomicrobia bacterium]|nr:PDGLE domain-containing protein [Verrucomicrobiota bacterium]
MHIPDGFIDGKTAATTALLSAAGVGLALRQARRHLPPKRVPLLGLAAAFLFAAQMVNFPVAGGTSGHLMGGVLVAALLGPSAAIVVLTTVLIVQCFLFADGGVLALGANIFNMAIIGAAGGYAIYRGVSRWLPGTRGQVAAVAFAGWCSTALASISCAGQLAWSDTFDWQVGFTAMTGVHMVIGIGEGLISALVFLAIRRMRPELASEISGSVPARQWGELVCYGLLVALGIAIFVAPFACPWPDGLESVAAKLGFEHKAIQPVVLAPAPGYQVPGVHWTSGATALAGAAGTLVVFGLALLLARSLVREPEVDTHPTRP